MRPPTFLPVEARWALRCKKGTVRSTGNRAPSPEAVRPRAESGSGAATFGNASPATARATYFTRATLVMYDAPAAAARIR